MLFVVFIISLVFSLLLIYLHKKQGFFADSKDSDKPQKFHQISTSRAGGIGVFVAVFVGIWALGLNLWLMVAGVLAFLSGIVEDFHGNLSPKIRLLIHTSSAVLGIIFYNALILDLGFALPFVIGVLFTIFAVVGSVNAINIIDGFNGLASGFSMMVLGSFLLASYMVGDYELMWICGVGILSILGFFVLNFPKGRIFLGDGGAYFVGFLIVQIAILLSQRHSQISAWFVLCVMIYPVYEVLFSAYRKKIIKNTSPLKPDGFHLHMLIFKRITKNNPKTAMLLLLLNAPFVFIPLLYANNSKAQIYTILVFIVCYHLLYRKLVKFKFF